MNTTIIARAMAVLALAFSAATSQDIAISGRVTNAGGLGLAGAGVLLKGQTLTTTSGVDGYFRIDRSSPVQVQLTRQLSDAPVMRNGMVRFVVAAEPQDVRLDVLDVRGRCLRTVVHERLDAGTHQVDAIGTARAAGLLLVRLQVGAEVSCFRCASPDANRTGSASRARPHRDAALSKGAAGAVDSLIVNLSGYRPARVGIALYTDTVLVVLGDGPTAGNPTGTCTIPTGAGLADTTNPTRVVGNGTPGSCTGDAFIAAVAHGGKIVFHCGANPVTITLNRPAKVFNDSVPDIVIDGGNRVTLSGGGTTRILYMNTCDQNQHWTSPRCDSQATPRLTVQNLTFVDGNSRGIANYTGGGAIWVRGGRFRMVNCRFFNNTCDSVGPDVGGAAVRVFDQFQRLPVYVVNCTFGGAQGFGNFGSNGGGVSSIGVSWTIINSLFSYNRAIGNGGNPANSGTPGGGSGGAIYNDGNTMTLSLCGCLLEQNRVNAFGSAIFFVTNDTTGNIRIENTTIRGNAGGGWNTLPGISMHAPTRCDTINSVITY
jgi:hypothetical protein